ncbi:peptidoglycan DD-metalloendopeptidase family protein [Bifidobacterium sp. MA2]|uniref:Peptidoglycan DD-metalloendopeptidase family protein n=2 Tax=Bifidobacterium santillanense TaxID=2809028 RepID=A0ABS5UR25_9BIFI|nr:peptidoglycan DD-metalloendopeptidase family protein [Bifidobacterium santillanense]
MTRLRGGSNGDNGDDGRARSDRSSKPHVPRASGGPGRSHSGGRRRGSNGEDGRIRMMAAMLAATGAMGVMTVMIPAGDVALASPTSGAASDDAPTGTGACRAALSWPVDAPVVDDPFDGPDEPWLAGHRGVDLLAGEGDELIAPADGVIAFAGSVAGKRVVSIRTDDDLVLTFEPAVTDLPVGTEVRRNDPFGVVSTGSDHCFGDCVHWGVRRGRRDYLDPEAMAAKRRIGLKPVE